MAPSMNPTATTAELEEARKRIFADGTALAASKHRMEAAQRKYNSAYELTPASDGPNRRGEVCNRCPVVTDILGGKLPIYDTPRSQHAGRLGGPRGDGHQEGRGACAAKKHIQELLAAPTRNKVVSTHTTPSP